jgi:hypothetical protein
LGDAEADVAIAANKIPKPIFLTITVIPRRRKYRSEKDINRLDGRRNTNVESFEGLHGPKYNMLNIFQWSSRRAICACAAELIVLIRSRPIIYANTFVLTARKTLLMLS